jgi:hypothetical protein
VSRVAGGPSAPAAAGGGGSVMGGVTEVLDDVSTVLPPW